MKRLAIILLSIILCVSFCACSNAKTENETTTADVGASIARPNDEEESTENASTTAVEASTTRLNKDKGDKKSDVIKSDTATTSKNKDNSSNQAPTEQDNVRVNANDLVGGKYF